MKHSNQDFRRKHGDEPRSTKVTSKRTFEITLSKNQEKNLHYFIIQEREYYNRLVESLVPRLRTFPLDMISMKKREMQVAEYCAEKSISIGTLLKTPKNNWPESANLLKNIVFDESDALRLKPAHVNMIENVSAPGRLIPDVRKKMVSEIFKHMAMQAENLSGDNLKSPVQMLISHSADSKRHLQIPVSHVKMSYDEEIQTTLIKIPYCNDPIKIPRYDLTDLKFGTMIIRSPHHYDIEGKWFVDIKDTKDYIVTLTDHTERRRKR